MKLPQQMRALTRKHYGGPEVLEVSNIPLPHPKKGDLLIKVHATTINRTDCGILRGKPFLVRFFTGLSKPKNLVPGTDFAGEVVAIGKAVKRFKVGDRVWGLNDEGLASQAPYMCVAENAAVEKIPENTSYAEAVACAEGAHYALNFINKVNLKPGNRVLVNGATGAIGSAAVQLLKHMNMQVTATANTKNLNLVGALGADEIVDYTCDDFTQTDVRYDFVFDSVGKSTFARCKPILTPKGIYISSELGPNAENLYLPLFTRIRGGKRVIFPIPVNTRKSIKHITSLLTSGAFKAVIDQHFSLDAAKEAYAYVESGQKTGNVILQLIPEKD